MIVKYLWWAYPNLKVPYQCLEIKVTISMQNWYTFQGAWNIQRQQWEKDWLTIWEIITHSCLNCERKKNPIDLWILQSWWAVVLPSFLALFPIEEFAIHQRFSGMNLLLSLLFSLSFRHGTAHNLKSLYTLSLTEVPVRDKMKKQGVGQFWHTTNCSSFQI